jgi:hypothetical protein
MNASKWTYAERIRILRQTLVQLFELQLHSGATSSELAELALECVAMAEVNTKTREAGENQTFDAQDYGSVLKTWHRQGQYLSKDGFPRPLPLEGKCGLRRLIGNYYPKSKARQILKSMQESGLIAKQEDGKWVPTARSAVFPTLNPELLMHLAEGVSRLIETVSRNVTSPSRDEALFERSTKVRSLPLSESAAFRRFVGTQGAAFLGAVDDWLEARSAPTRSQRGKTCTAGVFTFAFVEEVARKRSRATQSR